MDEHILFPLSNGYDNILSAKDLKDAEKLFEISELKNRSILIQDIERGSGMDTNTMIRFWNAYDNELNIPIEERQPIKIYIDSFGGILQDSLTIADTINMSKTPIWTINIGCAYSGGFLIFLSGHKKITYPQSTFLFHEGSITTGGDAHKFQNQADFYKHQRKRMKDLILSHTKITEEVYTEHEKDDWWLFAEEALKYGIADEIAETII